MDKRKLLVRNLKKFKEKISEEYSPEKMIFFGSRAVGNFRKDSDVDLVVVSGKFEGVKSLKRAPGFYLEWDLDYPVDFICYPPKEFERLKKRVSIVKHAIEEGIEI